MTEMGEVDHTHPITDRPFGERFDPTTAVVADGGERGAGDADPDRMGGVDHETPDGDGADPVFERGTEGRDDSV
jgi:hypothetical protein